MFFRRILGSTINKNGFARRMVSQLVENPQKNEVQVDKSTSVLDPISDSDDISHVSTYLKPTFNFAAYVNKSEILQELLKLGVNLHKIEKKKGAAVFILKLKFEDIKEHIVHLRELGLSTQSIARIITENPFILEEELENIDVRLTYLKYKKFTKEMRLRILDNNPFWFSYTTQQIDERLGFFQKEFHLSGDEVRKLAFTKPKLITFDLEIVKLNKFVVKEEMGLTDEEIKSLILKKPAVFHMAQARLLKSFEYFHKIMNIPIETIVENPEVLTCREQRAMQRHLFLKELGRNQYNPKKANYVSLKSLVSLDDATFATELAKSGVKEFNLFIKSL